MENKDKKQQTEIERNTQQNLSRVGCGRIRGEREKKKPKTGGELGRRDRAQSRRSSLRWPLASPWMLNPAVDERY